MRVGVLGFQGGVYEHVYTTRRALEEVGVSGSVGIVKKPADVDAVDALIIPGGESTTIGILAHRTGVLDRIRERVAGGMPVLGTCAGAIIMAEKVSDRVLGEKSQPLIGSMSIEVVRNYFGRQRESFEAEISIEGFEKAFRGVFIRSPAIKSAWGRARIVGWVNYRGEKVGAVAVQDGLMATAFHPELTGDTRIHRFWIERALAFVKK